MVGLPASKNRHRSPLSALAGNGRSPEESSGHSPRTEQRRTRRTRPHHQVRASVGEGNRGQPHYQETRKLLDKLGIDGHRNYYTLRHTFRTIADEAKDQPAADYIMGHEVAPEQRVPRDDQRRATERRRRSCAHGCTRRRTRTAKQAIPIWGMATTCGRILTGEPGRWPWPCWRALAPLRVSGRWPPQWSSHESEHPSPGGRAPSARRPTRSTLNRRPLAWPSRAKFDEQTLQAIRQAGRPPY